MQSDIRPLIMRQFRQAEDPEAFRLAMALRMEVFVDEQNVPPDEEPDHHDAEAFHWLLLEEASGQPVAVGRMIAYQEGCQMRPVAKIGRIAVKKSHRGLKLGDRLMQAILNACRAEGFDQAVLDAQTPVIPFYEKLGFVTEGDEFMDAGIPHYRMRLVL